jgi:hypothetical protein
MAGERSDAIVRDQRAEAVLTDQRGELFGIVNLKRGGNIHRRIPVLGPCVSTTATIRESQT